MEAVYFSETLVTTYKITWYHNPEDHNLNYLAVKSSGKSDYTDSQMNKLLP
jgi:hypothetical protein